MGYDVVQGELQCNEPDSLISSMVNERVELRLLSASAFSFGVQKIAATRAKEYPLANNIVPKFTNLGDVVSYACCEPLPQVQHTHCCHSIVALWDVRGAKTSWLSESMPFLTEKFSRQLLKEGSDLTSLEDVSVAAKTLVESPDAKTAKKQSNVWTVS